MKLQPLIDELQQIAHMGHAQDDIIFTDLINARGTKMEEDFHPKLIGYTACNGKVALSIKDERALDYDFMHPKPTCEFCGSTTNVHVLYKFTDDMRIWKFVRRMGNGTKYNENSWFCRRCVDQITREAYD